MTTEIKIYYDPQETGWAEVLHGRVARIVGTPGIRVGLCRNAIVLLDRDPLAGMPEIERVLYSPYSRRTFLNYQEMSQERSLQVLFKMLGCDVQVAIELDKANNQEGVLTVSHPNEIDVVAIGQIFGATEYGDPPEEECY